MLEHIERIIKEGKDLQDEVGKKTKFVGEK